MTLFGIALGSLALAALARRSFRIAVAVGIAQMAVLVADRLAVRRERVGKQRRRAAGAPPDADDDRRCGTGPARLPGRWYLAPELDALVRMGSLQDDGLWRDIWVYRGLPVVNGAFKGISADVLYPSGSLPIGRIDGDAATVQSADTLAVLGIGAVLALADEPVAPATGGSRALPVEGHTIRLLRNPGVWPAARWCLRRRSRRHLPGAAGLPLSRPLLPRLLGRGPGRARRGRHADAPPRHAARALRARPIGRERCWCPRCTGRNGPPAPVAARWPSTAAWEGLIAVSVPAGIAEVELRYRPRLVMALTALSGFVVAVAAVTLAVRRARVPARA